MRVLLSVLMFFPLIGIAASGGKGAGNRASTLAAAATVVVVGGSHGGGTGSRLDPRKVPPLASDRKINEQDCSKPIDWTAGNLKCR